MSPSTIPYHLLQEASERLMPAIVAVKGAMVRAPKAARHMAAPVKSVLERLDDLIARAHEVRMNVAMGVGW